MTENEALVYAQLPKFKRLIERTNDFIKDCLQKVSNPYVACSFGKDSSVMLHLVMGIKKDIDVWVALAPESDLLDNYSEVIAEWEANGVLIKKHVIDIDLPHNDRVMRKMTIHFLGDYDSYFIGIRKQESKARKMSLISHGVFYCGKNGKTRIAPLSHWSSEDIYAYIISNKIPLLNTYKANGIDARTSPMVAFIGGDELIDARQLRNLRNSDMSNYNKLIKMYPEAKKLL